LVSVFFPRETQILLASHFVNVFELLEVLSSPLSGSLLTLSISLSILVFDDLKILFHREFRTALKLFESMVDFFSPDDLHGNEHQLSRLVVSASVFSRLFRFPEISETSSLSENVIEDLYHLEF
jgi:hypothetical protein